MLGNLLLRMFGSRERGREPPDALPASRGAIDAYVASHAVRKLHLGAGTATHPGWLGTDVAPQAEGIVRLDAARPFPIDSAAFHYVYSEHMIEHMPWAAGLDMLGECRRILKPGGTLRVATPDLAVLIGLYTSRDPEAARYVRWIVDHAMTGVETYDPAFVINNAFRSWGHQFLYDAGLLEVALGKAGFVNIRRCAYGESSDPNLRGIECHGRNIGDEGIAKFETMVFEADAPGA